MFRELSLLSLSVCAWQTHCYRIWPVPLGHKHHMPHLRGKEFIHMRYQLHTYACITTAITSPDDEARNKGDISMHEESSTKHFPLPYMTGALDRERILKADIEITILNGSKI